MSYPAEPWRLHARALVALHLVDAGALPTELADHLPGGHDVVLVRGRAVVAVAVVEYGPGGVLEYDELVVAVLTHEGHRLRLTVPQIWVTTEVARDGGRALWALPKGFAEVTRVVAGGRPWAQVRVDGRPVLRLAGRLGARLLPRHVSVPLVTAQRTTDDGVIVSTNRVAARVRGLRGTWQVAADGPLGWLARRRPVLQLALTDASVVFGCEVERSDG